MRSSGSHVVRRVIAGVLVIAASAAGAAQGSDPARLFRETQAREASLRRQLDAPGGASSLLARLRTLVATYRDLARLFPSSDIADDALWHGGRLAADAFWQAGDEQDRESARRIFDQLTSEFPESALARLVPAQSRRLEHVRPAALAAPPPRTPQLPPAPAAETVAVPAAVASPAPRSVRPNAAQNAAPAAGRPRPSMLTGIRREVLPDALRITLELEQETSYQAERLDAPSRVFVDLRNTRAVDALKDAVLPYADGVVKQVRVGRQADVRTRVVFDLQGNPRHSVYTLYAPYRVVIDFEQPGAAALSRAGGPHAASLAAATAGRERAVAPPAGPPVVAAEPTVSTAAAAVLPSAHAPTAMVSPAASATSGTSEAPPTTGPQETAATPPARRVMASIERGDKSPVAPLGARPATTGAAPAPVVAALAPSPAADAPAPPAPRSPKTNTRGGFSLSRQLGLGIARIVIDPGHGGHDPGAKVRGLTEADLVLDVALRLEALLAAQPGVEVILTRRTNAFVSLEERTDIANRANADLFLSIHANASADARATGIESYFLNFAATAAAEAAAARENAASGRSMRHLGDIVRAIALNNKIDESRDLATMVQSSLHGQVRRSNRDVRNLGVKQAPFMVLIGATMPSVLTEIAFLTNRQEAALLRTDRYRQQLAEGLLAGITRYQQALKQAPAVASR